MPAKVVNVVANGNLGKEIDIGSIVKKITEANYNDFGGGMAEIALRKKIQEAKIKGQLTFEVCEETDENKIAKIRLFRSGKFTINCNDPKFIAELEASFKRKIGEIL